MMPVITICRVLFSLKKVYQTYWHQFLVTGKGVKEDDDVINLTGESSVYLSRTSSVLTVQTEKIQKEWPFYNDLHDLWSELPNYNPFGVTNSSAGQDFAAKAATVFSKCSGETDSSGVEDDYPNPDEEDDQAQAAGPHDADTSNHDSSEFDESGGWWGA